MRVINDPLGQTHSPASSDRYSRWNFILFCEILKSEDGRTDRQNVQIVITTGPWLLVGLVDQKYILILSRIWTIPFPCLLFSAKVFWNEVIENRTAIASSGRHCESILTFLLQDRLTTETYNRVKNHGISHPWSGRNITLAVFQNRKICTEKKYLLSCFPRLCKNSFAIWLFTSWTYFISDFFPIYFIKRHKLID